MPKLHPHGALWRVVCDLLLWRWSPQQIARTLQRMHPEDSSQHVSHETIYNAIYAYPRGELKKQLIALLRWGRSGRRPRSAGQDRRGQIPEMVSIHVRPPEFDDRLMPGHWEGDLIKGANNQSAVGVLVERSTRLVLLCRMPDATAQSALAAFIAKLNQVIEPMRQTLTYDQGKEMARHRELARATGVRVYFCDPHSPWQRGAKMCAPGAPSWHIPPNCPLSSGLFLGTSKAGKTLLPCRENYAGWCMPLELLREIASGPFPFKVSGQESIDKLRVLVAAEMVLAQMPDIGDPGPAWVGELTGLGRASLKVPFRGVLKPSPRDE